VTAGRVFVRTCLEWSSEEKKETSGGTLAKQNGQCNCTQQRFSLRSTRRLSWGPVVYEMILPVRRPFGTPILRGASKPRFREI
jgi:hypothetical protein